MGRFWSLLWIIVIQSTLSVNKIDGQELHNTSITFKHTSELSVDSSTTPNYTTASNSENKALTIEKSATTYKVTENENAMNTSNDLSSPHFSSENESARPSCELGKSCGNSETQFTSEVSSFATDSVLPTKSDHKTTDNSETPLSLYQATNTIRSSEQHVTTEAIIGILNLDTTTNSNLATVEENHEVTALEATNGTNDFQTEFKTPSPANERILILASPLMEQEVKKFSNSINDSSSELPISSTTSEHDSNEGIKMTSSISITTTTDRENVNSSNHMPSDSEIANAVNRNVSGSYGQATDQYLPTVHSTTSEGNSELLNLHSTQNYLPQTDKNKSTLNSTILATTQRNLSRLPEETTISFSFQTSITAHVFEDTDGSPSAGNTSYETNDITEKQLAESPIFDNGEKSRFPNSSEVTAEPTATSTDDSLTFNTEMSSTFVTDQFATALHDSSDLTQHPEEDSQTNKTTSSVPYSVDKGLTKPGTKDNMIESTFPNSIDHSFINQTETTSFNTNADMHAFNTDNLSESANGTLSSDKEYTDFDDVTKSRVSDWVSTSSIATITSTTVTEPISSEAKLESLAESVSIGSSTVSSIFVNLTEYTKPTRMPKILTISNESVTITIPSTSVTITQEDLTSSHEPLSSTFSNNTIKYEDITATETSLEFTELFFNRIPVEDLNEIDRKNTMTARFIMVTEKSDTEWEWLDNQTMVFHTWLLKTLIQANNLSINWMNEEKNQRFHPLYVLYIMPTPCIYNYELVLTFIVLNTLNNESIPTAILTPVLTSNANEICSMLNATDSYFVPGLYGNHTILKKGGILEKLQNEYGVIYIAVSIVFLIMLLLFLAIVSCIKCKKQGSVDLQFDKVNLGRDMHLALDMGHVNSALENFHDEECKKSSVINGIPMYSVDDNEGWLVPMGQKPIIDLNAPVSQDTPM